MSWHLGHSLEGFRQEPWQEPLKRCPSCQDMGYLERTDAEAEKPLLDIGNKSQPAQIHIVQVDTLLGVPNIVSSDQDHHEE